MGRAEATSRAQVVTERPAVCLLGAWLVTELVEHCAEFPVGVGDSDAPVQARVPIAGLDEQVAGLIEVVCDPRGHTAPVAQVGAELIGGVSGGASVQHGGEFVQTGPCLDETVPLVRDRGALSQALAGPQPVAPHGRRGQGVVEKSFGGVQSAGVTGEDARLQQRLDAQSGEVAGQRDHPFEGLGGLRVALCSTHEPAPVQQDLGERRRRQILAVHQRSQEAFCLGCLVQVDVDRRGAPYLQRFLVRLVHPLIIVHHRRAVADSASGVDGMVQRGR